MADKYHRVEHDGGHPDTMPDDSDKFKQVRGGEEESSRKNRKTCCYFFNINHGYHAYGIFDTIFTFTVFLLLVTKVAADPKVKAFSLIVLFAFLPNTILYFVSMCQNS